MTTVPVTVEAFLLPFAKHFRSLGWRIDVLTKSATQRPGIAASFDTLYDITWSRNPLALADHFDTWNRVRRIVVEGGYQVVHAHTPIAAFITRFALRSIDPENRPVIIYTAHGFHFYKGQPLLGHTAFKALEATAAPWTDYLVTINEEDYASAKLFKGISQEKIRLIPGIGVDTEIFSQSAVPVGEAERIRRELNVDSDAFLIAMVAEFSPVKRHEHLLRALAMTRDSRIVTVFAGSGDLEPRLRQLAEELGVASRVRWAGFRNDIPALLAASDVLTLVSEREGLPRSILEAMSMGVPVIGTQTRGITDAVGDTGWIVAKHDVEALASAIDAVAADRSEVRRKGALAQHRAREEFAIADVLSAYEALYAEALKPA
ncbi:MAG: glycosyltransferase [Actinobacteria bacterium]|nr:glycosyltransferase [Actinomycetota bacterium]